MNVLKMENMDREKEKMNDFFYQLNIKNIKKMIVRPKRDVFGCCTYFHFEIENKYECAFCYYRNQKVASIIVWNECEELFLNDDKTYQQWMDYIWEQFVDHFHLRIRLMFINEENPWIWNKEFNY